VEIDKNRRKQLAGLLGWDTKTLDKKYPFDWAQPIAEIVGSYHAVKGGSKTTTLKNTRRALGLLYAERRGKLYEDAVNLLSNERAGVDCETSAKLIELAQAVLRNEDGAKELLAEAAQDRDKELSLLKRVDPRQEPFREFCGLIGYIFFKLASESYHTQRHLIRFAREVLDLAGVTDKFLAHPEQLAELLKADIHLHC